MVPRKSVMIDKKYKLKLKKAIWPRRQEHIKIKALQALEAWASEQSSIVNRFS